MAHRSMTGRSASQRLKWAVLPMLVTLGIIAADAVGCHNTELHPIPSTTEHLPPFILSSELNAATAWIRHFDDSLFFTFAPPFHYAPVAQEPIRVKPQLTQWGDPWDHSQLSRNMDSILLENGVKSFEKRVRMVAHAIVSSGWRQNVWHYNAWGVKRGSWDGQWYQMNTVEVDPSGLEIVVADEEWRAFRNWDESVKDYLRRITRESRRPSYRQAARHLASPDRRADVRFWRSLGEGNYYTTQKFSPGRFAALCFLVRQHLSES